MQLKITLTSLLVVLLAGFSLSQSTNLSNQNQLPSDDPSFYMEPTIGGSIHSTPCPCALKAVGITSSVLPCDGGIDTLVASGGCGYVWSTDSMSSNVISNTDTLITGTLANDTTFYLGTVDVAYDSLMGLPAQSSPYNGNVRGYYFTAPIDFIITGLRVPTDASTGAQNIEVLKFDNQTPPPAYSSLTNAFTSLGYWSNYTGSDTIQVCFPVSAGDVIGIYGNRADINSYGAGSYVTSIGGIPVTLERSGMQYNLSSNQMFDVWSEAGGSISRIEMFYDITPDTTVIPVNVVVPQSYASNENIDVCSGDSIWVAGAYQTTSGTYVESLQTVYGCDSIITSVVTIVALPTVTLASFATDSICLQAGTVALPNGTPAGGIYTGTGVSAPNFDPAVSGAGTFTVTYTYSDSIGCMSSATAQVNVLDCAGIEENTLEGVTVFPNPASSHIFVNVPDHLKNVHATLFDASGKRINAWTINSNTFEIDLKAVSGGMYILEVEAGNEMARFKLLKN